MVDGNLSHSTTRPMIQEPLEHRHLIVRAEVKNTPLLQDLQFIRNWIESLVDKIGMELLIPPQAAYCDKQKNRGVTALAGLTTSSLSLHIWDEVDPAIVQFDLYSCRSFILDDVLSEMNRFHLGRYEYYLLDRSACMMHIHKMGDYAADRVVPL